MERSKFHLMKTKAPLNRNLRRHSSDQSELQATSTLRWKILKTKRSFIYTDRCDAHTTAGTKTELFRKRSSTCSNPRNLKTPAFRFCVHEKRFENGTFRKRRRHDNHVISPTEFSSNTNKKFTGQMIVAFFFTNSETIWYVFRVKLPFQFPLAHCGRGLSDLSKKLNSQP